MHMRNLFIPYHNILIAGHNIQSLFKFNDMYWFYMLLTVLDEDGYQSNVFANDIFSKPFYWL